MLSYKRLINVFTKKRPSKILDTVQIVVRTSWLAEETLYFKERYVESSKNNPMIATDPIMKMEKTALPKKKASPIPINVKAKTASMIM